MRRAAIAMAALALGEGVAGCGGGSGNEAGVAATTAASTAPRGDVTTGFNAFVAGTQPACGECHTLADAHTSSKIGPNLDETKPTFDEVMKAMNEGPGAMPSYNDLRPGLKADISAYVESATHEGG